MYHYFEDKQALVRAVIDHYTQAVLDTQGTHLDTVAGLRAWRTRPLEAALDAMLDRIQALTEAAGTEAEHPHRLRA